MFTRRDLLKSALLLPVLPRLMAREALAQASPGLTLENLYTFHPQFRDRKAVPLYQAQPLFDFTGGEAAFSGLIDTVVATVADPEFSLDSLRSRSTTGLGQVNLTQFARFLSGRIEADLETQPGYTNLSTWEKQWLLAEGICEWVKRSLRYDYDLVRREEASGSEKESIARTEMSRLLGMPQPAGSCWHIALAARDLARAAGLKTRLVNGHYRGFGEAAPPYEQRNHSVVTFDFDGLEVPADVTSALTRFHQQNSRIDQVGDRKVGSQYVLSRDNTAWNLFLASFNAAVNLTPAQTINGDVQNIQLRCAYTYQQWSSLDTTPLKQIDLEYIDWEKAGRRK